MSIPGVVSYEAPHVPAAFINHIHEEGTKAEAVQWLQRTWNDYQAALEQIAALKAERSFVVASVEKVCVELEGERDALCEMVLGAIALINGDCPLTETNCDDWLKRARALCAKKEST